MTPARPALPGWRDQRGVSWVTVLLLLCLAAGGYLIWVWGPIYLVHYEAKQVVWERTKDPPTLRIAFEYTRPVRYPLVDRESQVTLEIDQTFDVNRPEWGPSR